VRRTPHQNEFEAARRKNPMIKLFEVTTIVHEFNGCKDVQFTWLRTDVRPLNKHGPQPRPYTELIEDYDAAPGSMSGYPESSIESLFDDDEAKQLKAFIDLKHGRTPALRLSGSNLYGTMPAQSCASPIASTSTARMVAVLRRIPARRRA
jgi:hypothetical protein